MKVLSRKDARNNANSVLEDFLISTKDDLGDITLAIKSTMVQFLLCVKEELRICAFKNGGYISTTDLLQVQINELRECVIELSAHLTYLETNQGVLQ